MKLKFVLNAVLVVCVLPLWVFANTQDAEQVVRLTTDQVLERITAQKSHLEAHPEQIYDLIDELVIPHFDFFSMAKWVLGRNWKQASEEQRQAFLNQFRTLLVRTYAKALLEYSQQEIRFLPVKSGPNANLVTVMTEVSAPGDNTAVPINYRMHVRNGAWKVVDVAVDGVSLVSTYRGSFASEIRKSGLDGLIAKLTERNEQLVSTLTGSN